MAETSSIDKPAQVDVPQACSAFPALNTLSPAAQEQMIEALVSSGIANSLKLKIGTPQERADSLRLGLEAVSNCDSRIKDQINSFNRLLAAPQTSGSLPTEDASTKPYSDGPPSAKDKEKETEIVKSEKFKVFLKLFREKFYLQGSSELSGTEAEGMRQIFRSERIATSIFKEPHLSNINALVVNMFSLPGGSVIEKGLASIEIYREHCRDFLLEKGEGIENGRKTVSSVISLINDLGLIDFKPHDVWRILIREKRGADLETYKDILQDRTYMDNLREFLSKWDRQLPGYQAFSLALQATYSFAQNAAELNLSSKSVPPDLRDLISFGRSLELNTVLMLARSELQPFTSLPGTDRLKNANSVLRLLNFESVRIDLEEDLEKAKKGELKYPDGFPMEPEFFARELRELDTLYVSEGTDHNNDMLNRGSLWNSSRDLPPVPIVPNVYNKLTGGDKSEESKIMAPRTLLPKPTLEPLTIPLSELSLFPKWESYLSEIAQRKDQTALMPDDFLHTNNKNAHALRRLTVGFVLFLARESNFSNEHELSQFQKLLGDKRFTNALTETDRIELGFQAYFQQIDKSFYRYEVSRQANTMGLTYDERTNSEFLALTPNIQKITESLKTNWKMKSSSPEAVYRIARDEKLTEFFLNPNNAEDFKNLLATLLGRDTFGAEEGLLLDNPQVFVDSFNKRDQLLVPSRLAKIRQTSTAEEVLTTLLKRHDDFATAVNRRGSP